MSELRAVYPFGAPGNLTCTPDNNWLFVAEGGSVAIIDATDQDSYEYNPTTGAKRVPVGQQGVLPSALRLDPEATISLGAQDEEDLLYIAGGRAGLWVMEADPAGAGNRAARIDDSGNAILTTQNSRRWCNSLGFMKLDVSGTDRWFLVALFSRVDKNRLRVYAIEDVRQVMQDALGDIGPEPELGHETLPLYDIQITGNSNAVSGGPDADPRGAYAFGYRMTVDNPDTTEAYVYVALGSAGLVRVRFVPEHFESPPVVPPPLTVEDGPAFGDGTDYANANALYGHFRVNAEIDSVPTERWNEPPFFTDVAVQDWSNEHFLYAAVDHLGWVRFDLTDTWDGDTAIDHHEGFTAEIVTGTGGTALTTDYIQLLQRDPDDDPANPEDNIRVRTYARELELVHNEDIDGVDETVVLVSCSPRSIRTAFDPITEGYWMGFGGLPLGPYFVPGTYDGIYPYTFLYRESRLTPQHSVPTNDPSDLSPNLLLRAGGCALHAAQQQGSPDQIIAFCGEDSPPGRSGTAPFPVEPLPVGEEPLPGDFGPWSTPRLLVDYDAGDPDGVFVDPFFVRAKGDRAGIHNHETGTSIANPDLFLPGFNDGGMLESGLLYLVGENEFHDLYMPNAEGEDQNGVFAFIGDPQAQWLDSSNSDRTWMWGMTPQENDPAGVASWEIAHFDLGEFADPAWSGDIDPLPEVLKRVSVDKTADRFNEEGRASNVSGSVSSGYDAHSQGQNASHPNLLWAGALGKSGGITVINRDLLEALALADTDGFIDPDGPPNVVIRHLNIHPEFDNVPDWTDDGRAATFPARLIKFQALLTTDGGFSPVFLDRGDKWITAVPANSLCFNVNEPGLSNQTMGPTPLWIDDDMPPDGIHDWAPSAPFADKYSHALVALVDITDSARLMSPGTQGNERMPRVFLIGPNPSSSAFHVTFVQMTIDSEERYYCVCTNFGGSLFAYDITDLDDTDFDADDPRGLVDTDPEFAGEWTSKPRVSDPQSPNNVFSVVADVIENPTGDDDAYLYVSLLRRGVVVLKFDPTSIQPFTSEILIQTGWRAAGLHVREKSGEKTLVVSDHGAGVRLYGKPEPQ